MAESHVISGLVSKRSELAGLVQYYQAEISRITRNIQHLDASIKLFDPDFDLRTIRAKEHREKNPFLKSGEATRMVLDVLRGSEAAMTSRQIAEGLLQRKGAESSTENIERIQNSALNVLKRLENKGLIIQSEKIGQSRTWRIA
ncbi:MAG: hypothetical protein ACU83U_00160 [Gammaproteobacteria bacterium]